MDHLVFDGQHLMPPVQVPFFPEYEYDGLDFATFPERQGFTKNKKLDIDRPCCELKAFVQAWLYFGLIEVFTRKKLKLIDFMDRDRPHNAEKCYVHSQILSKIIPKAAYELGPIGRKWDSLTEIADSLRTARYWSDVLDARPTDDHEMVIVVLSIQALVSLIRQWEDHEWSSCMGSALPPISFGPTLNTQSNSVQLINERLHQAGWCARQVQGIGRAKSWTDLYQLSSICRREPASKGIDHAACTMQRCLAYEFVDQMSRARHVQVGCECDMLEAPFDQIVEIVQRGGTPLIDLRAISDGQTGLKVVEWTSKSTYTVVSHLDLDWQDSSHSNSMPRCQLQLLSSRLAGLKHSQRYMRYLSKHLSRAPLLVWMESLCMPTPFRRDRTSTRMKVMDQMSWIYAGAKQVLVLDDDLTHIDANAEPSWQRNAVMANSRWNTRGWSLLEGCLSKNVLFQFLHSTFKIHHVDRGIPPLQGGLAPRDDLATLFVTAWNELGSRSITNPEEIHIILSVVLGFSPAHIISVDIPEERTKAILDAIGYYPLSMLCNPNTRPGATSSRPYRWVPAIPDTNSLSTSTMLLQLTSKGLQLGPRSEDPPAPPANQGFLKKLKSKLMVLRKLDQVHIEPHKETPEIYLVPRAVDKALFWFTRKSASGKRLWYKVKCDQPMNNCLTRNGTQIACLIIEPVTSSTSPVIRGVRLLVTDRKPRLTPEITGENTHNSNGMDGDEDKKTLHVAYDCPITCHISFEAPTWQEVTSVTSILRAERFSSHHKLVIEHPVDHGALTRISRRGRDPRVLLTPRQFYLPTGLVIVGLFLAVAIYLDEKGFIVGGVLLESSELSTLLVMLVTIPLSVLLSRLSLTKWQNRRAFKAWRGTYSESWV